MDPSRQLQGCQALTPSLPHRCIMCLAERFTSGGRTRMNFDFSCILMRRSKCPFYLFIYLFYSFIFLGSRTRLWELYSLGEIELSTWATLVEKEFRKQFSRSKAPTRLVHSLLSECLSCEVLFEATHIQGCYNIVGALSQVQLDRFWDLTLQTRCQRKSKSNSGSIFSRKS